MVRIERLPVRNSDNPNAHCWVPIIEGRVIEYKGEPPRSVKAAKKAAAAHLNTEVDNLEFDVRR